MQYDKLQNNGKTTKKKFFLLILKKFKNKYGLGADFF